MPSSYERPPGKSLLSSLTGAAAGIRRALSAFAWLMNVAAGWSYIVAAVFITADALFRRYAGFSSDATSEISGYILAFGISWSLGNTLIQRAHIRIDMVVMKLPLGLRQYLHLFALLLLLALALVLCWSVRTVLDQTLLFNAHDISGLSIPLIVPQGLWAFGVGFFTLLLVSLTVESALLIASGDSAAVDRLLRSRGHEDEVAELKELMRTEHKP